MSKLVLIDDEPIFHKIVQLTLKNTALSNNATYSFHGELILDYLEEKRSDSTSLPDYIFIDLGYRNKTNLAYNIDEFRFKVDDKKVTKATNVQSVEIKPLFILFDSPFFQKTYRNIIVLKKMSFPGNKLLHIELSEKQLSGRVITLNVSYKDVLDADTIPL